MRSLEKNNVIKHIRLYGIKNTVVSISVEKCKKHKNRIYKILADGEERKIEEVEENENINILAKIPKKTNNIKIIVFEGKNKIFEKDIKNYLHKRIYYKNKEIYDNTLKSTQYCWNKNVGVKEIKILGDKTPIIKIIGSVNFDKCEYIIKADNKTVKHNELKCENKKSYILEAKLNPNVKKVQFFIRVDGKEEFILERKITKLNKIGLILKSMFAKTKYNYNKNIGIENCTITGIKNALFSVWGSVNIEKCNYMIKIDGKETQYEKKNIGGKYSYYLETKLPRGTKKIEFFLKMGDEEYLIVEKRNSLLRRVSRKIKYDINKIVSKVKKVLSTICRGIRFLWKEHHFLVPLGMWKKYINHFSQRINTNDVFYNPMIQSDYLKWIQENEENEEKNEKIEKLEYNPLISILIPVYNVERKLLVECLNSILKQSYKNFEICLADDCSTKQETIKTLKEYEKKYKEVKVVYRKENGHISKATNSALEIATGEFIGLVDNDDMLTKDALYEVVKVLNENKKLDFIYSDEDKLDLKGNRCEPHFKPDFSPDLLMSFNYICHFSVIRTEIMKKINGFEVGMEGSQDYDLFLKVVEQTQNIYHIPKILYHWRMIEGSTSMTISSKSYAIEKGKKAIENALKRRNIKGKVEVDSETTYYKVKYLYDVEPKISIIIPTRDYASTLKTCLDSLYEVTEYKNFEVIIMNNQSKEKETFELFEHYKEEHKNFKVIDVNTKFNYSNINNIGIENSKGEYILLLNNDTEILNKDWLSIMVGYAMQKHIGTVGAKLYYPDMTVQHAGIIMGLGGVASHAYIGAQKKDLGVYARLRVPYNYSGNTAACLMIDKKKFLEVNGLEEELEVAYNDVDFNMKVLEKGYYNVCLPQVELIHFESKSRGLDSTTEKYQRFLKESEYMYKKWKIKETQDRFYNSNYSLKGFFVMDKK